MYNDIKKTKRGCGGMGFFGSLIFSALYKGFEYGFKKLKTRKATAIRFGILGALCAFNLIMTIVFCCQIPEFWWLSLISTGAIFCMFVWRFVWDGILLVKNDFDAPHDAPKQ